MDCAVKKFLYRISRPGKMLEACGRYERMNDRTAAAVQDYGFKTCTLSHIRVVSQTIIDNRVVSSRLACWLLACLRTSEVPLGSISSTHAVWPIRSLRATPPVLTCGRMNREKTLDLLAESTYQDSGPETGRPPTNLGLPHTEQHFFLVLKLQRFRKLNCDL